MPDIDDFKVEVFRHLGAIEARQDSMEDRMTRHEAANQLTLEKIDKKIDGVADRVDKRLDGVAQSLSRKMDEIAVHLRDLQTKETLRRGFIEGSVKVVHVFWIVLSAIGGAVAAKITGIFGSN